MASLITAPQTLDERLASRLKALRHEQDWSLDELSNRCGVSRSTLSGLEKQEVSPTASILGKLCATYGLPMSRLMAMAETAFLPHFIRHNQPVWTDPASGFTRRSVSPPAETLRAEVIECELAAGQRIDYASPPRPGLEHHLIMLDGYLEMTVGGHLYQLYPGDCLRYLLLGPSLFATAANQSATYMLVIV
ncbi:MAG: helix-turn-helix transcriptional regulator [Rhodospirillales bacterium]|nr:helix-turn-helix transcriptional regulator [Rhodospirillales bacterium]